MPYIDYPDTSIRDLIAFLQARADDQEEDSEFTRAILAAWKISGWEPRSVGRKCGACYGLQFAMRFMAAGHYTHPDYRPEWAITGDDKCTLYADVCNAIKRDRLAYYKNEVSPTCPHGI